MLFRILLLTGYPNQGQFVAAKETRSNCFFEKSDDDDDDGTGNSTSVLIVVMTCVLLIVTVQFILLLLLWAYTKRYYKALLRLCQCLAENERTEVPKIPQIGQGI